MNLSPALRYARANSGLTFRPDADTILWLPGQDDAYSSTVRDRSGQGNNGTITGASWERTNKGLWYLGFDGADDNVNCGDVLGGVTTVSVECWFKVTSTFDSGAAASMALFDKPTGPTLLMYLASADGKLWFQVFPALTGAYQVTSTTTSWTGGTWYHVVGTDDGTNKRLYVNGVLENTVAGTHDAIASDNLFLGERSTGALDLNGGIALPRVYDANILSLEVVKSHRRQERHLFGV